jgi:ribosomal protein S18 acetylase RimI-like enzyme
MERDRDGYLISDDPARLDRALIHRFLSEESYWAAGIPRDLVERALDNSICFGVYRGGEQVGFARAVTDRATFAYLSDVFVLDEHRGLGLGQWLVETVLEHPDLQGLRQFILGTWDAHSLYERFGWHPLERPERFMTIEYRPEDIYG